MLAGGTVRVRELYSTRVNTDIENLEFLTKLRIHVFCPFS